MSNKEILATLFDDKTVRVLDKLLEKKGTFYLRELSKESDVSLATTYRIVQRLLELGVVEKNMRDKFVFYSLKADVPIYGELYCLLKGKKADPLESFCEKVTSLGMSVYSTKNNQLFMIGSADGASLKSALNELSASGKKFKHMILKEDQFKQMVELGLIDKSVKRLV